MLTQIECIPCMLNQGLKTADLIGLDDAKREELIRAILAYLHGSPWPATPAGLAGDIHRVMAKNTGVPDPYKEVKSLYNNEILALEEDLKMIISQAEDPLRAAIKLAVSGNIIDFGTHHAVNREVVLNQVDILEHTPLILDESAQLDKKLEGAKTLLYLGDNCGEIVFDRIFIEFLKERHPHLDTTFAVRGAPIINDVTLHDARETGMDKAAAIIDNGDDSPGTVLDRVSPAFRKAFYEADVIISKGQGNYESLGHEKLDNIFFLFMAKCGPVARSLGVKTMSLICSGKPEEMREPGA